MIESRAPRRRAVRVGIHGGVPAPNHDDRVSPGNRGVVFRVTVSLHKVGTRQVSLEEYTPPRFSPGDAKKPGQASARSQEDGVYSPRSSSTVAEAAHYKSITQAHAIAAHVSTSRFTIALGRRNSGIP